MARLRHLIEQEHRTSSKDGDVKETSWSICFPICTCSDCLFIKISAHFLPLLCIRTSYLCVMHGVWGCGCVGVLERTWFSHMVDSMLTKLAHIGYFPKQFLEMGPQSQVKPENIGLRIHQDLVVNISGLSQGQNELLITWYQAAFEFLMFWLLKFVHLLIMFINFWWIVCLHLCLIFKALLKKFITALYILNIWALWQSFAIFSPSLALVFH